MTCTVLLKKNIRPRPRPLPYHLRRKLRRGYNNSTLFFLTKYGEGAGGSKWPTEATFHITVKIGREYYTTAAMVFPPKF